MIQFKTLKAKATLESHSNKQAYKERGDEISIYFWTLTHSENPEKPRTLDPEPRVHTLPRQTRLKQFLRTQDYRTSQDGRRK